MSRFWTAMAWAAGILMATTFAFDAIGAHKSDRLQVTPKTCFAVQSTSIAEFLVPDLQRGLALAQPIKVERRVEHLIQSPE